MKDHPLLYTGDMVIRILTCAECGKISVEFPCCHCGSEEFCKTQTRRVPVERYRNWKVGDTLWVRETWRCTGGGDLRNIIYRAEGDSALSFCGIDDGRMEILHVPEPHWVEWDRLVYKTNRGCDWRSPIHMFKWAARIFLEITNIRVERVQDIMGADCVREGCPLLHPTDRYKAADEAHEWFQKLWDPINAKRGYDWDKNPFVWVIGFKLILKGE